METKRDNWCCLSKESFGLLYLLMLAFGGMGHTRRVSRGSIIMRKRWKIKHGLGWGKKRGGGMVKGEMYSKNEKKITFHCFTTTTGPR